MSVCFASGKRRYQKSCSCKQQLYSDVKIGVSVRNFVDVLGIFASYLVGAKKGGRVRATKIKKARNAFVFWAYYNSP